MRNMRTGMVDVRRKRRKNVEGDSKGLGEKRVWMLMTQRNNLEKSEHKVTI